MTAVPTIGVFALQGDVREHVRAIEECGASALTVRRPEELERVHGLILPGGESTTMWKLARTFELFDPLRKKIESGLPAYGSCAGMIMLADRILDGVQGQETLGGIDMTVRRNAFGRQVDSFEGDVDVDRARREPVHAVFIRAPWVERSGTVSRCSAVSSPAGRGRIVAVRQRNLLATSFHPELTGDARVHRIFVDGRHGRRRSDS